MTYARGCAQIVRELFISRAKPTSMRISCRAPRAQSDRSDGQVSRPLTPAGTPHFDLFLRNEREERIDYRAEVSPFELRRDLPLL